MTFLNPRQKLFLADELDSDPEVLEKRSKAYWKVNRMLVKEELKTRALGRCPKCYLVMTTEGKCPMGH